MAPVLLPEEEHVKQYDLSGLWQVVLDAEKVMEQPVGEALTMQLPGTTSAAGLGPENPARETGFLTDSYKLEGRAWFSRTIIAEDWQDCQVLLTLERTRVTTVYMDGVRIGTQNSLSAPHRYALPGMAPGEHRLTICVDNTDYPTRGGHLTSPDTQSNWNGITGELSIKVGKALVTGIRIRPAADLRSIHVIADVTGPQAGQAVICAADCKPVSWEYQNGVIEGDYPLPDTLAKWDNFHPSVHKLSITVGEDKAETTFGLRHMQTKGRKLLCNGQEVFLRGKHDGLIFPLTGYAPTDTASWRKVLQTAKDYGINHYRFHTCCPPDAAFTAADELGIFFEPELPFWGTITEEGEEKHDPVERAYLISEGYRMLREYGHHPSFVMMSMGNELWGSKTVLNRMLADYRSYDPDKLYISGSNNFQFVPDVLDEEDVFVGVRFSRDRLIRGSYAMCDAPQGIVQVTEPESASNYDEMIVPRGNQGEQSSGRVLIQYGTGVKEVEAEAAGELVPQVPVIAHEVGQYEFYPDFDEIDRYTGPLKARNFEVFRERLQKAGLWTDHDRFFQAAGKLAVDCYRREIEAFMRSGELAGFQLLDLQDFTGQGTALVGILNALMENKGLIQAEKWRRFCADTVVLAEYDRFVLQSGDRVQFRVLVSACDETRKDAEVTCKLLREGETLRTVTVPLVKRCGRLTERSTVDLGSICTDHAEQYVVRLELTDGVSNEYPLWVYPDVRISVTEAGVTDGERSVRFVHSAEEALACGTPAVVIPAAEGKLKAEYCSDFWCYPMFRSISEWMKKPLPTGTMGLCIEADHPMLHGFAAEDYTTPNWYHLLAHAHCEPIGPQAQPIVQMIDNVERCQRLGILYQENGVTYLTARLWEAADYPEVRSFAKSIIQHMYKK